MVKRKLLLAALLAALVAACAYLFASGGISPQHSDASTVASASVVDGTEMHDYHKCE